RLARSRPRSPRGHVVEPARKSLWPLGRASSCDLSFAPRGETSGQAGGKSRAFVDERGIDLDERSAAREALLNVLDAFDAASGDEHAASLNALGEQGEDLEGTALERRAREPSGAERI